MSYYGIIRYGYIERGIYRGINNHIKGGSSMENYEKYSTLRTWVIVILALLSFIGITQAITYREQLKEQIEIIEEYEERIEYLENRVDDLKEDSDELDLSYTDPVTVELSAGKYKVGGIWSGDDINVGTYNIYAKSGYGLVQGNLYQGYFSETIGYASHIGYTETYEGLYLAKDDEFTIKGQCTLVFEPVN